MNDEKKWYAVYTKSRCEKKVVDLLNKKGIENYCPLNRTINQWSDRKKIVFKPLFTSYVFVRISMFEQSEIRKTNGIINFVYWLSKPAPIKSEEILIIKKFLNNYKNVQIERSKVQVDDIVKIISGPLMEKEGYVVSLKNKSIKIFLPSLGYLMYAEIESSNIEIINPQFQTLDKITQLT
jgi:transcription antitermination factor NusG